VISAVIVGETRISLWNSTMVRRRRVRRAFTPRAFSGIDRLKGKFRSFLLAPFQNRLSDQVDRARRLKDAEDAEERYRLQPAEFLTAEKMFDANALVGSR
jgi:hypothetical protein